MKYQCHDIPGNRREELELVCRRRTQNRARDATGPETPDALHAPPTR